MDIGYYFGFSDEFILIGGLGVDGIFILGERTGDTNKKLLYDYEIQKTRTYD